MFSSPRETRPSSTLSWPTLVRFCWTCYYFFLPNIHTRVCVLFVVHAVKAASGVQTKTFLIDFASADDARWEALLGELKPIEVGVLGAFVLGNPLYGTDSKCTSGAVNCVGVSHEFPTDFVDTSEEELNTIVDVNVSATLRITSLIAPAMVSRCVSHFSQFTSIPD